MEAKQTILMFPWLAHGHVSPYLELAKNLSNRNFNIFFCSTPINLTSVREALGTTPASVSINLVELDVPPSPELPPEYHTTKNVPPNLMPKLHQAFHMSKSSFSTIITSLKPDLLIYDVFQTWAATIASSQGIPAVHFATTGAAAYAFYYHNFTNRNSPFPYEALYLRDHEWKALQAMTSSNLREKKDQGDVFSFFTLSCDFILMKTSRDIEGKYIDYLSVLCGKKVVAVGPLVIPAKTEENHSEMMQWLSKKSKFSTVYISFGSENYLSKNQIQEMAKGVEASNVNFIWVLRFPNGEKVNTEEALPKGFVDRTRERGMVVEGWAPQSEILAHPSIGAFMSHCGMNSTIETIYFGVPVIGIPLKLDQPVNSRLTVEAGVGLEVIKDANGDITGEEVAKAINKVVFEKTGEDMRLKAEELSKKMKHDEEYAMNEASEQIRRLCVEHKVTSGLQRKQDNLRWSLRENLASKTSA